MNKNLLKILIIISLFLPIFSFAAFKLEYVYPTVPGTGLAISADSSLGNVIKYFVSWAIIIGAIVAFLSLIYAGILYLTSTGKPEAMRTAKSRIFNSFLGLTILLGSYLILVTVNPQLVVMRVERVPVVSGVVLLNSTSTKALKDLSDEKEILTKLEELINDGNAYSLQYDIKDCKEVFGELAVTERETPPSTEAKKVDFENFRNFTIGGIGFLKNAQGKAKVILYDQKDFKGKITEFAYEYNDKGRINPDDGNIETQTPPFKEGAIKIINFPSAGDPTFKGEFTSKVEYVNKDIEIFKTYNEKEREDPLITPKKTSNVFHPPLSIQVKNITPGVYLYSDKLGEEPKEQPLISNYDNLAVVKFNDKARRIEIKTNERINDYLAILHEDPHWAGQLRIFFEKRLVKGQMVGNTTSSGSVRVEIAKFDQYGKLIAKTDQYGKVKEPSSIHVFELAEDPSVCSEVRLCTAPDFMEYCISYTPTGGEKSGISEIVATSTLPIYSPQNIPTTNFADNIKSIKIEGDCSVALFENPTSTNYEKCLNGLDTTKCWEGGGPGSHSEIFTESVRDLSSYEIHKCRGMKGLLFWQSKSCASAIAIYPIKK